MLRTLVIHLPGLADIHYGLKTPGSWVLGSSSECDIAVRARGVSRRHLKLASDGASLVFEDLGSTNGTYLNGEKAKRGALKHGNILQAGECTLFLGDTKTDALARPEETAGLPVITTIELKLPPLSRNGQDGEKLAPAFRLVEMMEKVAKAGASQAAIEGICAMFAESLGCSAAKCFRREEGAVSLLAVHGDFPDEKIPHSLVTASIYLLNPTILDLGGKENGDLLGICMPVPIEKTRYVFFGVVPASEEPLKSRFEAFLSTPVMLRFMLRWAEEIEKSRETIQELAGQVRALKSAATGSGGAEPILGSSPALQRAVEIADLAAPTDVPVLIIGETGTGKELFARRIHARSQRNGKPFVAFNCSSIPETLMESELFGAEKGAFTGSDRRRVGLFEKASGGTLFLDEIADLPMAVQPKLLRVLEEQKICPLGSSKSVTVDVRILSASNRNLRPMLKEAKFRDDLYYRIAGLVIDLPPLSLRGDDIKVLAMAFLERANRELGRAVSGFEDEALEELARHPWPGNVRELLGAVRRIVLTAEGPTVKASRIKWALNKAS